MRVRFSKNAGIMRVNFLLKCGYYAGIKSQKCGYLTEKMEVLCGYFKGAIPFPPFLCVQKCSLFTLFISQLCLVQSRNYLTDPV